MNSLPPGARTAIAALLRTVAMVSILMLALTRQIDAMEGTWLIVSLATLDSLVFRRDK